MNLWLTVWGGTDCLERFLGILWWAHRAQHGDAALAVSRLVDLCSGNPFLFQINQYSILLLSSVPRWLMTRWKSLGWSLVTCHLGKPPCDIACPVLPALFLCPRDCSRLSGGCCEPLAGGHPGLPGHQDCCSVPPKLAGSTGSWQNFLGERNRVVEETVNLKSKHKLKKNFLQTTTPSLKYSPKLLIRRKLAKWGNTPLHQRSKCYSTHLVKRPLNIACSILIYSSAYSCVSPLFMHL